MKLKFSLPVIILSSCLFICRAFPQGATFAPVAHNPSVAPEAHRTSVLSNTAFSLNAFSPIDPVAIATYRVFDKIETGGVSYKEVPWPNDLSSSNVNPLLPNHSASVITYKRSASGGLTYLPATFAIEKGSYRVVMDYLKFRDEPIFDPKGEFIGNGRVGVGLRLIADVSTTKANLDLGSLMAIGVNAKLGNLKGSLYVTVIGMDSADITNLIPLSSVIDETTIQASLQSLAAIKTKIHDPATKLTPHIVAVSSSLICTNAPSLPKDAGQRSSVSK